MYASPFQSSLPLHSALSSPVSSHLSSQPPPTQQDGAQPQSRFLPVKGSFFYGPLLAPGEDSALEQSTQRQSGWSQTPSWNEVELNWVNFSIRSAFKCVCVHPHSNKLIDSQNTNFVCSKTKFICSSTRVSSVEMFKWVWLLWLDSRSWSNIYW